MIPGIKIVAIVNSFNRLALLQTALPSLVRALQGCAVPGSVVVYEAGSTDGSREWLDRYAADSPGLPIRLVALAGGDNSFSAGVNAACTFAAREFPGLRYYLLFETDNWIASPEPLLGAITLLEHNGALGAAGFTVRTHAGSPAGYGCRFPTVAHFIMGQQITARLGLDKPNQTRWEITAGQRWRLCDAVYTSPLLIKKAAWVQCGGFDASLFPFSDCDLDWAWRLQKSGSAMAVIASDDVVHDNGEALSEWSARRVLTFHRARFRLLHRHRGGWLTAIKPLLFARHLVEYSALRLATRGTSGHEMSLRKRRALLKTVFRNYDVSASHDV